MARVMAADNADKERVRDASDIVRIVGEHVALKARGREYAGLCPFHDDHRPSMNVVPAKQIFHCFVCGSGGDVFSFVQKYHKMEFREALEYLAERAGITLSRTRTEPDPGAAPGVTRADLLRANASAADFFRTILRHAEHGRAGRETIEKRGISAEMVERFGLGLAPDRWDGLVLTARKMGMHPGVLVEAGLMKEREDGSHFDMFRHRLIFPIQDQIGRPVAFGGRKLREEDEPKYLNSPETRIFEKAGTLYGLSHAARAIQTERVAVITEGYTDTIACHQAGFTNVVATLGTALTPRHAQILRRMCDTVVLLFDGDAAGQKAADRAVDVFIREDIGVRIATLSGVTDAKDPDELLKRDGGADVLRRAIDASADLLLYRYERVRASLGSASPDRLLRIIQDEIARLVELGLNDLHPVRRHFIIRRLAQIAGVREEVIERSIPRGRQGKPAAAAPAPLAARPRREQLLGCLLTDGAIWLTIGEGEGLLVAPDRYADGPTRRVAEAIADAAADGLAPGLDEVLRRLDEDADAKAAAVSLAREVSAVTDGGVRVREHWDECARYEQMDALKAASPALRAGAGGSGDERVLADRLRDLRDRASVGDRRVLPTPVRSV